ncbi:hypothetical protein [Nocardia sp. CDC160]|uniref:hypothetical protein n=1 Tax=Nocardia sp. CDC160 TaxID=3112166 RepID=UPI002DBBABC2|nr:hypothetical protein [Nocardia sp. CDC160]MEC3917048.1 hypothetical protein [Nocardia sp. CDC160]
METLTTAATRWQQIHKQDVKNYSRVSSNSLANANVSARMGMRQRRHIAGEECIEQVTRPLCGKVTQPLWGKVTQP